jgi:CDP-glycerol glycerophosphotransferase (TagB/SpsB family)
MKNILYIWLGFALEKLQYLFSLKGNYLVVSFSGVYHDNLRYIYEYLSEKGSTVYWVEFSSKSQLESFMVSFWSIRGLLLVLTSRYILVNGVHKLFCHFNPGLKKGRVVVQLNHGVPIHEPSRDEYFDYVFRRNERMWKYYISTSDNLSCELSRMFGVSEEKIFSLGYPRNDCFSGNLFDKRYILYCPTWRPYKYDYSLNWEVLNEVLLRNDYNLKVKLHMNSPVLGDCCYSNIEFITNVNDIQPILADASLLITDYSSIVIDYLLLDRPYILYCPDVRRYENCYRLNSFFQLVQGNVLAGSFVKFTALLNDFFENKLVCAENLKSFFHKYDDCNSASRIVDMISNNELG